MIIVKIELHSARTGENKEIGRMLIDNVSGNLEGRYHKRGNYRVRLLRRGKSHPLDSGAVQRQGEVTDFPRLSYSIWRLVFRSLKSVLKKEK